MFDTILNHRSIRKYTGDPIPVAVVDYILEAGTRTPTTGNMQLYSVIVTTEESIKKGHKPVKFPDFTRGAWQEPRELGVSVWV